MSEQPKLSKRVLEQLIARRESQQWEVLIARLLKRLEIDGQDLADAKREYAKLADRIAAKLQIPRHDVNIFPHPSDFRSLSAEASASQKRKQVSKRSPTRKSRWTTSCGALCS